MRFYNLRGRADPDIPLTPGVAVKPSGEIISSNLNINESTPAAGNYHLVAIIFKKLKAQQEISRGEIFFLNHFNLGWIVPSYLINPGEVVLKVVSKEVKKQYLNDKSILSKASFNASSFRNALGAFNTLESRLNFIIHDLFALLQYAGGDGTLVTYSGNTSWMQNKESFCTKGAEYLVDLFKQENLDIRVIGKYAHPGRSIVFQNKYLRDAERLANDIKRNSIYVITETRALQRELNRTRLPLPLNFRQFITEFDSQAGSIVGSYSIMKCEAKFKVNSVDMKGDAIRIYKLILLSKQLREILPILKDVIRQAIINEGLENVVEEESLRIETLPLNSMTTEQLKAEIERATNRIIAEKEMIRISATNDKLSIERQLNQSVDPQLTKELSKELNKSNKKLDKTSADIVKAVKAKDKIESGNINAAINELKPSKNVILPLTILGALSTLL